MFHIGMVLGKDWGFILTIRNVKKKMHNPSPKNIMSFILTIRNVKLFEGKKANRNKFVLS